MNKTKESILPKGFLAGKPVTGKQLVGREDIIRQVSQLTLNGQSVVLVAPRRFGKTSVILEILRRLKRKSVYSIYIDFFSTPTKEILAEKITESVLQNKKLHIMFYKFKDNIGELLKHVEFKRTVEDFNFILSFADVHKDPDKLLLSSIDFIDKFSVKNNKKMVCAFDEFGDLKKLDGSEIVKLFRSKIQLQKNAAYIFSGRYESVINDLFICSHSPFYRFARVIKLRSIAENPFKKYLINVFSNLGIKINDDSLDFILNFTGGHPYYTQLICQQIELGFSSKNPILKSQIVDFIESAMWVEINYIEKLWEELTRSKENIPVLLALAKSQRGLYSEIETKKINVARALKRLQVSGIVEKIDKYYQITDPLFLYWIKRNILGFDKTECV